MRVAGLCPTNSIVHVPAFSQPVVGEGTTTREIGQSPERRRGGSRTTFRHFPATMFLSAGSRRQRGLWRQKEQRIRAAIQPVCQTEDVVLVAEWYGLQPPKSNAGMVLFSRTGQHSLPNARVGLEKCR